MSTATPPSVFGPTPPDTTQTASADDCAIANPVEDDDTAGKAPRADPLSEAPSAAFIKRIPIGFARSKQVLGLATDDGPMRIAMADPRTTGRRAMYLAGGWAVAIRV